MFLAMLQEVIALFSKNKEASKTEIDAAFTAHAAACADADQKCQESRSAADKQLWETIKGHLDARGADAEEVGGKAAAFESYAVMIDAEHQRMRQLASGFAEQIDQPPPTPGPMKIETIETVVVPAN